MDFIIGGTVTGRIERPFIPAFHQVRHPGKSWMNRWIKINRTQAIINQEIAKEGQAAILQAMATAFGPLKAPPIPTPELNRLEWRILDSMTQGW